MGGRPRSTEVDHALREAAIAVFIERGFPGLSLEEVARRAGVSRAALYRRWPDREALLADALKSLRNNFDGGEVELNAAPLGSLLAHLAERAGRALADPMMRRLLRRLLTLGPVGERLRQDYHETVIAPRRAVFAQIITAARDAGEIEAKIDPVLVQDAVAGALAYKLLSGEADDPQFDGEAYALALFEMIGLR